MKKYKLIKEFPGSPKLGHIIIEDLREGMKNFFQSEKEDEDCYKLKNYSFDNIINFPEFWEEIIEKDYEILSLSYFSKYTPFAIYDKIDKVDGEIIYYKDNIKEYIKLSSIRRDKRLYNNVKIHSIKRLSDGEIFTVKDVITLHREIIHEFELLNNELKIWYVHPSYSCPQKPKDNGSITGCGNMYFTYLNNIKKVKQPLFITEDGVDIFEGDEYWIAHDNNYGYKNMQWTINSEPYKCINIIPSKRDDFAKHGNYRFSTKEKAEEYILMNKPCLSLKEVLDTVTFLDRSKKNLIAIVESKIQQSV